MKRFEGFTKTAPNYEDLDCYRASNYKNVGIAGKIRQINLEGNQGKAPRQ